MWGELTIMWSDLTIVWSDLTWSKVTMERSDRNSIKRYPVTSSHGHFAPSQIAQIAQHSSQIAPHNIQIAVCIIPEPCLVVSQTLIFSLMWSDLTWSRVTMERSDHNSIQNTSDQLRETTDFIQEAKFSSCYSPTF